MIRTRLFPALLPALTLAVLANNARSAPPAPKSLSVAIAVPSRGPREAGAPENRTVDIRNEKSHFHVVVTNTTGKPQRLWETWNSWGYYNLRFEVADGKGKVIYAIKKKPRFWTRNFPSWFELAPGEQFVMDVYFDRENWELPFLKKKKQGVFRLKMRAIFENKPDMQTAKYEVWTGKITTPFKDYQVRYWR